MSPGWGSRQRDGGQKPQTYWFMRETLGARAPGRIKGQVFVLLGPINNKNRTEEEV